MKSTPRATRRHGESHAAATAGVGGGDDGDGDGDDQLVISLPHPRVLRVIARSLLVTVAMLLFPWLRSMILPAANADSTLLSAHRFADEPFFLPMLLRDLKREGLLVAGAHGSAVYLGNPGARFALVKQNKMFPVMSEIGRMAVPDRSVDFVLATDGFTDASFVFVERVLRIGGVTIIRLNSDPKQILRLPANYRIVYIRRFGSTVVGIKKMAHAITTQKDKNAADLIGIGIRRRLLAVPESSDKASSMIEDANAATEFGSKLLSAPKSNRDVLNRLEEAFLEPPFDGEELTNYKKRTTCLADMLSSSLNEHLSSVSVDVGPPERAVGQKWFVQRRNSKFEVMSPDVMGKRKACVWSQQDGELVGENVKESEFVVMKVESEVAEEMLKKATGLTTGLLDGDHE